MRFYKIMLAIVAVISLNGCLQVDTISKGQLKFAIPTSLYGSNGVGAFVLQQENVTLMMSDDRSAVRMHFSDGNRIQLNIPNDNLDPVEGVIRPQERGVNFDLNYRRAIVCNGRNKTFTQHYHLDFLSKVDGRKLGSYQGYGPTNSYTDTCPSL